MNKVFYIFLDIDGVMNNETYFMECFERHHIKGIMSMNCFPFDPKCLMNLMYLSQYIETFDYKPVIILSSTWRLNQIDIEIVNSRLAEYGLRITDKTPNIDGKRGNEILQWLKEKGNNTDKYIILDDEVSDITINHNEIHIVNTNFTYGFEPEKLVISKYKVNKMLGGESDNGQE